MIDRTYVISRYKVVHSASDSVIELYVGTELAGYLRFVGDESLPDACFDADGKFNIYFGLDRFAELAEMFRSEKDSPIQVYVESNENLINDAHVTTDVKGINMSASWQTRLYSGQ